jgi:separase
MSITRSPGRSSDPDVLAPDFLASVLKQQSTCYAEFDGISADSSSAVWLQRNEPRTVTGALLERYSALPRSRHTKADKLAIVAKLALHDAHIQFRSDIFLSSLTESSMCTST